MPILNHLKLSHVRMEKFVVNMTVACKLDQSHCSWLLLMPPMPLSVLFTNTISYLHRSHLEVEEETIHNLNVLQYSHRRKTFSCIMSACEKSLFAESLLKRIKWNQMRWALIKMIFLVSINIYISILRMILQGITRCERKWVYTAKTEHAPVSW